uniref:AAA-ATPase-like domain-containing protein n=1 Tax=Ditylenchus dipsaci TaxID=166011 RepID=A0A915ER98_9BILA
MSSIRKFPKEAVELVDKTLKECQNDPSVKRNTLKELLEKAYDSVKTFDGLNLSNEHTTNFIIKVTADKTTRTLRIEDKGCGMSRTQMTELNIKLADPTNDEQAPAAHKLGFLSALNIADRIQIQSKKHGDTKANELDVSWTPSTDHSAAKMEGTLNQVFEPTINVLMQGQKRKYSSLSVNTGVVSFEAIVSSDAFVDKSLMLKTFLEGDHAPPVLMIHLDLSNVTGSTIKQFEVSMETAIQECFDQHIYLVNALAAQQQTCLPSEQEVVGIDLARFKKIYGGQEKLTKEVIALIDESDSPIHKAIQNGVDVRKVSNLLSNILQCFVKKNNRHLHRALLTGLTGMAANADSCLNNIKICKFQQDHPYSSYYGFTAQEVDGLLTNFQVPRPELVKQSYGGYSKEDLQLLIEWVRDDVQRLLEGKELPLDYNEDFTLDDFEGWKSDDVERS